MTDSADDPRLLCFATHHKGGTHWIKRAIRALAADIDVPWVDISDGDQRAAIPETGRVILCHFAGRFPEALLANPEAAVVHIIRDPRDILISGCHDHHIAPAEGGAGFLHRPRPDLDGRTYAEHLNRLERAEDKLLFEMRNRHAETVAEMLAFPEDTGNAITLRYEDLIADTDCYLFQAALARLGLDAQEQALGVKAFSRLSPLAGAREKGVDESRLAVRHIRWPRELPRDVGRAYADEFGAALARLDYEQDESWVERLQENPKAPAFPVSGRAVERMGDSTEPGEGADPEAQARRQLRAQGLVAVTDKETPQHLRAFDFPAKTIIDVGVDTGTPFLYRAFPEAHFLLIDPRAESREALAERGGPAFHEFHQVALGAEEGEVTLRIPLTRAGPAGAMAGIRQRIDAMAERHHEVEERSVPVVPLDQLTEGLPGPFGLKIDTEGYEYEVLLGAPETLRRCAFVILELSVTRRFEGVAPPSRVIALLAEAGLELRDILRTTGDGRGGPTPRLFDALFARWEPDT